ncbi:hypothetical protein FK178_08120 [Antarcticibacterium arcticum]|uniref:Damage-inducible protein DinB n=1 Tax=Antarcticibacterium arcticum TaxID=2585771 RepID=A0A5B8YIB4_9FLAO|nr:DinB family protein [Antarcticibacterium arcticum]QED37690.1 hypothetical protein FK178_08120 [Antarcticibacterium arcticum]
MELKDLLIPELQYEVVLTEKFLNRIPADKMDWRPHPRSMSIRELANHLAEIPGYIAAIMHMEVMDISGYKSPSHNSVEDIIKLLKENTNNAEKALRQPNSEYEGLWKLTREGKTLVEMPRINMLRSMAFNQLPHHRAQLGVYFRLLDIPVPATYGPSADEN